MAELLGREGCVGRGVLEKGELATLVSCDDGGKASLSNSCDKTYSATAVIISCLMYYFFCMSDFLHSFLSPFTSGVLTGSSQRRRDVDVDFFLMFSVVDENLSWYLDENIASFCTDPASVDKEDEEFQESNKMHGQYHLSESTVSAETLSVSAPGYALRSCAYLRDNTMCSISGTGQ